MKYEGRLYPIRYHVLAKYYYFLIISRESKYHLRIFEQVDVSGHGKMVADVALK